MNHQRRPPMKKLFGLILILVLIVAAVLFFRNQLTKYVVAEVVQSQTGLRLEIDDMDIGLTGTYVDINKMTLHNPIPFQDPVMISIPEVFVNYDLMSVMTSEIHLEEIRIDVDEFLVVKNADGKVNVEQIEVPGDGKKEKPAEPEPAPEEKGPGKTFRIDVFKLRIGKVIYKDYSKGGEPTQKVFNLNINEQFTNVTNLNSIIAFITFQALINTTIPQLANIDMSTFNKTMSDAIIQSKEILDKSIKMGTEKLEKSTEDVKQLMEKANDSLSEGIEGTKEQLEEVNKSISDQLEDSKNKLQGLFGTGSE